MNQESCTYIYCKVLPISEFCKKKKKAVKKQTNQVSTVFNNVKFQNMYVLVVQPQSLSTYCCQFVCCLCT